MYSCALIYLCACVKDKIYAPMRLSKHIHRRPMRVVNRWNVFLLSHNFLQLQPLCTCTFLSSSASPPLHLHALPFSLPPLNPPLSNTIGSP